MFYMAGFEGRISKREAFTRPGLRRRVSCAARGASSEHTDAENQILLGAPSKKNSIGVLFVLYGRI